MNHIEKTRESILSSNAAGVLVEIVNKDGVMMLRARAIGKHGEDTGWTPAQTLNNFASTFDAHIDLACRMLK